MTDPASPGNRKLIEGNAAAQRDQCGEQVLIKRPPYRQHPRNLHQWFAPMPLPALRALIFAALVDDQTRTTSVTLFAGVVAGLVPDDGGAPTRRYYAQRSHINGAILGTHSSRPILGHRRPCSKPCAWYACGPVLTSIGTSHDFHTLTQLLPAGWSPRPTRQRCVDRPLVDLRLTCVTTEMRSLRKKARLRKRLGWAYPHTPGEQRDLWRGYGRVPHPCGNPACQLRFPLFGHRGCRSSAGRGGAWP
ncbi:DUF1156 domain-containing protein [Pseudonocardia sp. MCCB 268]|nr:DUF1156 domain-containing protein [Pseudonocardia cytotoxica]